MAASVVTESNNWHGASRYVSTSFTALVLLIYDIKLCSVEAVGTGCSLDPSIMPKTLHVVCYHSKRIGAVNVSYFIYRHGQRMHCKASAQSLELYYKIIDLLFELEKMILNAAVFKKKTNSFIVKEDSFHKRLLFILFSRFTIIYSIQTWLQRLYCVYI